MARLPFWICFLVLYAAAWVLSWLPSVGAWVALLFVWPQISIQAKRLHDFGRSARLVLVPICLSFAALAIVFAGGADAALQSPVVRHGAQADADWRYLTAAVILLFADLGFLLWLGLTPGDPEGNRYGAAPLPLSEKWA